MPSVHICPESSFLSTAQVMCQDDPVLGGARLFLSQQPMAVPGPRSQMLHCVRKTHTDLLLTLAGALQCPPTVGSYIQCLLLLGTSVNVTFLLHRREMGDALAAPPGPSLTCVGSWSDGPCHCAPGLPFLKTAVCAERFQ